MKQSIIGKLDTLAERFEEISALLSQADIIANQNQFRKLSRLVNNAIHCFRTHNTQVEYPKIPRKEYWLTNSD